MICACTWVAHCSAVILSLVLDSWNRPWLMSPGDLVVHYLDDFLSVGPARTEIFSVLLCLFQPICCHFWVPLAEDKTILPNLSFTFLGMLINTELMECSLLIDKLDKIKSLFSLLHYYFRRRKVLLKVMQSLLGLLAFSFWMMSVGRVFSRGLCLPISGLKSPFSHVILTKDLKEDLIVCMGFLDFFNGKSFLPTPFFAVQDFLIIYRSAGSVGFVSIRRSLWCIGLWPIR